MQICTAQQLISHPSVKVPSAGGSPVGPGPMSRTEALGRGGRGGRGNKSAEELCDEEEEDERSRHLALGVFAYK